MDREVRYVTTADGVRIAYSVEGDGIPYVFVPGWISHLEIDAQMFSGFGVDEVMRGIQNIQMDKRGTGLSSRNLSDYSLDARVADVKAVVDDLGLSQFALGGLSEGGPIAIAFAARFPSLVSRLVMTGSYANGAGIGGSPDIQAGVFSILRAEWGLASKLLSELFVDKESVLTAEAFAAYQRTAANAEDAYKILEAAVSIDVRPLLSQVKCPTLVVHGRDDRVVPIDLAQELAAGIKGARFLSFPGGHVPSPDVLRQFQSATAEFVRGGAAAAQPDPSTDGGFRTVLFTDIVGHTEMMRRLGDDKGRAVLREQEQVTREVLKANGGSEVKTMGDGFMASFTSVTKAVACAIALQRAFEARNADAGRDVPAERLYVRCGLNAGEPIQEDGDLFGETVILAARIAAEAQGGEVLASMAVRELCAGKGFLFADVGEKTMRGFEDPVRVFEVRWRE